MTSDIKFIDECLNRIDLYRDIKENSIFDSFYHVHLDCMQEALEIYKESLQMNYSVIFAPEGHTSDRGSKSPVYLTVCKNPHWKDEGLLLQGSIYDATKFNPIDNDIDEILSYCRAMYPDKQFCVTSVDKRILGSSPREVWDEVKGDYAETKCISGRCLTDCKEMKEFKEYRLSVYNERIKKAEAEFHQSRKIFAIFDDKLNWCPNVGLSHHEWLVDSGLFSEEQFNTLVRGYEDNDGVYFYSGDFETSEYVEDTAKSWMNSVSKEKPVYCGVVKGKVGDKWKPIKTIREKSESV